MNSKRLILIAATLAAFITGCSDDEATLVTSPTDTAPVMTVIGKNPDTITVHSYYADLGASVVDAEDGIIDTYTRTSTVDTSQSGVYSITYSAIDSDSNSVSAVRTVHVLPLAEVTKSVTGPVWITLTPGIVLDDTTAVYILNGSATVSGDVTIDKNVTLQLRDDNVLSMSNGTLTINEGATLLLSEDAYISISTEANIVVHGADTNMVVFGAYDTNAYWGYFNNNEYCGGILINSNASTENEISYAVFDMAKSAIYSDRTSGLSVTNTLFSNSKYHGVIAESGSLVSFTANAFSNSGVYDVYTTANNIGACTADLMLDKGVALTASTLANSAQWPALTYFVLGAINVGDQDSPANQVLKVDAGAEFIFTENAYIEVAYGMSLNINGIEGAPVTFKSGQKGKYWGYFSNIEYCGGIWINDDAGSSNVINYAVFDSAKTAVYAECANAVSISNCTFTNSQYQGLILVDATLSSMDSNSFAGNGYYDIYTSADNVGSMTEHNTMDKGVCIVSSSFPTTTTWPALNYIVMGTISAGEYDSPLNQIFTINAGAKLSFMKDAYIEVAYGMSLDVKGTSDMHVVFDNAESGKTWGYYSTTDYCGGIWLNEDAGGVNSIDYAEFINAVTGVYVEGVTATISNSTFTDYAYYAIINDAGTLTTTDNIYQSTLSSVIGNIYN